MRLAMGAFNVHHSPLRNKAFIVPHGPYTSPSFVFEQRSCWGKKKNATRCLMFNLVIYFLAGGAQSENRALYFTKNLDYVITGLLTFTPTKPSSDG